MRDTNWLLKKPIFIENKVNSEIEIRMITGIINRRSICSFDFIVVMQCQNE